MEKYTYAEDIKIKIEKIIAEDKDLKYIDCDKLVFCRIIKHLRGMDILGKCILLDDKDQFFINKKYLLLFPPVFDLIEEKIQEVVFLHLLHRIPIEENNLIDIDFGKFNKINKEKDIIWFDELKKAQEKLKLLKEKERLEKKLKKQQEPKQ